MACMIQFDYFGNVNIVYAVDYGILYWVYATTSLISNVIYVDILYSTYFILFGIYTFGRAYL